MKFLLIFLFLGSNVSLSQDLRLIPLTTSEINRNVKHHYQYESKEGHLGLIDLWLLKNGSYEYQIASNTYESFSTGHWKISKDILTLNSDIQADNLPIAIIYRSKDESEPDIKKIAFIKDLDGNIIDYAFVYINNDSISCMDGDLICKGKYEKIDSIKVGFENHGISSRWVSVKPFDGVIQITIKTHRDLRNYVVFDNRTYKVSNTRIVNVKD